MVHHIETVEQASRTARYAANASRFLKVLSIVGIFTDAFIMAFDVSAQFSLSVFALRTC